MNIQTLIEGTLGFIENALLPTLLAIAFLAFVINTFRYFILHGTEEDSITDGRNYMVWSFIGFVVIFSLWGIVNLLSYAFGPGTENGITPDYMCDKRDDGACVRFRPIIDENRNDNFQPPADNDFDFMDSTNLLENGGGELVS